MTTSKKRRLGAIIAVGAAMTVALCLGLTIEGLPVLAQTARVSEDADTKSAHVVVQFADGDTAVRPVTWTGTISRVIALQMAGFVIEDNGDTVCKINGEGCPADNCFCPDNLWAQGQWAGLAWDETTWPPPEVMDGDVIAFRMATQPDYSDWGVAGRLPSAPTYVAAADALEWMRTRQQPDGSYADSLGKIGASNRALIALGSAGYDPAEWGDPDLLSFLTVVSKTETIEYAAESAGRAGKLTLGLAWTGQSVTDFAGINLPISITTYYSPTTGAYGDGSGDTVWASLGLYAAGEAVPDKTVEFLASVQNEDGGWSWNEWGATSETQHTATCVQAMLAAGEPPTSTVVAKALVFLRGAQNADGGWPYTVPGNSDIGSTASVLQAFLSAGETPPGNWCAALQNEYLVAMQEADGGYPGFSPLYATHDAIPSLMQRPYGPLAAWSYNCYGSYLPLLFSAQ